MAALIPCFIEVVIRHPEADWGIPRYTSCGLTEAVDRRHASLGMMRG